MRRRTYLIILIISTSTILFLAGLPSWISLLTLTVISILIAVLNEEGKTHVLERGDLEVLSEILGGANSVNAISRNLGVSWATVRRRVDSLAERGFVIDENGVIKLTKLGETVAKGLSKN